MRSDSRIYSRAVNSKDIALSLQGTSLVGPLNLAFFEQHNLGGSDLADTPNVV